MSFRLLISTLPIIFINISPFCHRFPNPGRFTVAGSATFPDCSKRICVFTRFDLINAHWLEIDIQRLSRISRVLRMDVALHPFAKADLEVKAKVFEATPLLMTRT